MRASKDCVIEKLDTPDAFRVWLAAKKPDAIVGTACVADKCPIHSFISDACETVDDGDFVVAASSVGCAPYETEDGGRAAFVKLPEWTRKFIRELDHTFHSQEVQAVLAIATLNTVLQPAT